MGFSPQLLQALRVRSAPPRDAGISVVGIVLALAAIGIIVIAAIVAFVIPN